jgi:hypothetical protein
MDRIVHSKGQRYTQILTCEEHGSLLLDLRLVRNFNETWRVRHSISVATAEAVEEYKTKLAESAAGRRPRRPRRRPRRPIGEGGAADSASEKAPASVGAPEE